MNEDFIEKLDKLFHDEKTKFENMLGVPLDFSKESLQKLERVLDEMFPFHEEKPVSTPVVLILGYYFGETIRKSLPFHQTEWEINKEEPFASSIEVHVKEKMSFAFYPFIRMHNFLNEDREDGLYALCSMAQDLAFGKIPLPKESFTDKWINDEEHYRYRIQKNKS